jgi:hypothetical protein
MVVFGKRGADIDFTLMHRKGLIKVPERKTNAGVKVNSQGMIDFSGIGVSEGSSSSGISSPSPFSSEQSTGAVSPFGFLDSMASANSSSSPSGLENSMRSSDLEVNALKLKVDDLDFKIGQLMEKLATMEIKLYNFERNVR